MHNAIFPSYLLVLMIKMDFIGDEMQYRLNYSIGEAEMSKIFYPALKRRKGFIQRYLQSVKRRGASETAKQIQSSDSNAVGA